MKKLYKFILITCCALICVGCSKENKIETISTNGCDKYHDPVILYDKDMIYLDYRGVIISESGCQLAICGKNNSDETINLEISDALVNEVPAEIKANTASIASNSIFESFSRSEFGSFHVTFYDLLKDMKYEDINNIDITIDISKDKKVIATIPLSIDVTDVINNPELAYKGSLTEKTYSKVMAARKGNLHSRKLRTSTEYIFNDIPLLPEDCEWIENSHNKDGSMPCTAVYMKIAYVLSLIDENASERHLTAIRNNCSEYFLDYTPDTNEKFLEEALKAKEFIVMKDQLRAVMTKFEQLNSVTGNFDHDYKKLGKYEIVITDLKACAEEMGISEEMLGYILAMLEVYEPELSIELNTCTINYESKI